MISHRPVLLQEVVDILAKGIQSSLSPRFADLTFGAGGHSLGLLERMPQARIVAYDRDPEAVSAGLEFLRERGLEKCVELGQGNFADFSREEGEFDGILLDLGLSSHLVDTPSRGFSFRAQGPLDMRMDGGDHGLTATTVVNSYSLTELARIFRDYGEERFARRIARAIVAKREEVPLESTLDLAQLVVRCYPPKCRHGSIHPATRVFQALRIEVNNELDCLKRALEQLPPLLKGGGVLVIISFHSLEDRLVKHCFRDWAQGDGASFRVETKKPLMPSSEERKQNPRSRSAKLRALSKISSS